MTNHWNSQIIKPQEITEFTQTILTVKSFSSYSEPMENNINIRIYHLKWKIYDPANYKTKNLFQTFWTLSVIIGLGREPKSSCEL